MPASVDTLTEEAAHAAHIALAANDVLGRPSDRVLQMCAALTSQIATRRVTVLSQLIADSTGVDPLAVALTAAEEGNRRWRRGAAVVGRTQPCDPCPPPTVHPR